MTNAQHTPGPWLINHIENCGIRNIFPIYCEQFEKGIVTLEGYRGQDDIAEIKANARLIAAAPDLLESLKLFILHAEYHGWDSACTPLKEAYKAIAKATGE